LGENLNIPTEDPIRYSLSFCVRSTPGDPCEEDFAFGSSVAEPRSITTKAFMRAIPEIFKKHPDFKLRKYAEIDRCPACNDPLEGEFGFFVSNQQLDSIGPQGANIRVFVKEGYRCDCKCK